ncbi:uncharacterized mitochondrial protein AtMg00810-like [Phragmites australis]|uniref:uncharacterized mitochondrial protein AtMg00810-like n=1 Tax=Phragmites australis TaxID=29695 RepID=UPI002D76679F|nr:uncharacterized mitochondrial protein AtMg00810-like [Phragmites australis]
MSTCNPCAMPIEARSKLVAAASASVSNPTLYHSLAGALQYLTFTNPDITHAVQQVCLHMHDPREHFLLIKCILRYIKGTISHGPQLSRSSSHDLIVYNADWAGCPNTRKSTSGIASSSATT